MENGTQMMLQELIPENCRTQTAIASDFRVNLSVLQESDAVLQIQEALSFLRSCGLFKSESLDFFSLKTSKDYLTTMGGYV